MEGTTNREGDTVALQGEAVVTITEHQDDQGCHLALHGRLDVKGHTPFLVWPMVSLLVTALVFFAWPGRRPDFRPGGAHAEPAEAGMTGSGPG